MSNDNVAIVVYYKFDAFQIIGFDIMFVPQGELLSIPIEHRHPVCPLHVYMRRFMLLAIEEKRETEKSENLRHI